MPPRLDGSLVAGATVIALSGAFLDINSPRLVQPERVAVRAFSVFGMLVLHTQLVLKPVVAFRKQCRDMELALYVRPFVR